MIEVRHLYKEYKIQKRGKNMAQAVRSLFHRRHETICAVSDVSFSVRPAEIVGYIGPNGAGKSTTIKILSGILVPTKGEVQVGGLNPWKNRKENARQIGVVFGQRTQLWWDIPVLDSLVLMKYMYRIPKKTWDENMGMFSEILGLAEFL
ncbi:MAG: ATP-binding cassette domain-containing protein, partial [Spirochaetaceae bacterium]